MHGIYISGIFTARKTKPSNAMLKRFLFLAAILVTTVLSAQDLTGIKVNDLSDAQIQAILSQGKERGIAFAIWGSTIGGMVAVGPVLGGWLATDFTWRWAFMINLPLGILILAGLILLVPESKSPQRAGGIDWIGAAISVVMFSTLVFGLIYIITYIKLVLHLY